MSARTAHGAWSIAYFWLTDLPALLNAELSHGYDYTMIYHDTIKDLGHLSLLSQMSAADVKSYMVDDILTKVDRASMMSSVEARTPILDHRVVEFTARLPDSLKRRSKTEKYLMRQLLYQFVPRE